MKNGRIVGIGCFGKPETFFNVFAHVLKNCISGAIQGSEPTLRSDSFAMDRTDCFIQAVMRRDNFIVSDIDADPKIRTKKIVGFFLALEDCHLNLYIFLQGGYKSGSDALPQWQDSSLLEKIA